jgi:hypothetical protein
LAYYDLRRIDVTASNSYLEAWRLVRLNQTVGYLYALTEFLGSDLLFLKLAKLHDHKGELCVTWNAHPTRREASLVDHAWRSAAGDGPDADLEHEVVSRQ